MEEILKMAIDTSAGDTEAAKGRPRAGCGQLCLEMKRGTFCGWGRKMYVELGFILADLLNNLERVADHCSNVALGLIEGRGNPDAVSRSLRYRNEDFKYVRNYRNTTYKLNFTWRIDVI